MAGFPRKRLARGARLYRIHRTGHGPWWFSHDGSGRFDLSDPEGLGTCYLAERPLGSFVEGFRDTALVDERDVEARVLSSVPLRAQAVIADCCSQRARAFGVTAAIHSSEDYDRTQLWANAFARAGFDGVRYLVSHDPGQRLVGVALFGPAGAPAWPPGRAKPIPDDVIEQAGRIFGIRVVPRPRSAR